MTRVLRQRRWRSALSLLTMVAWLLGTHYCALGLMAGPCHGQPAEAAVSACPHCPAPTAPEAPPPTCCQDFLAEKPSAGVVILAPLPPVALPAGDWMNVFVFLAPPTAPELSPTPAPPDTGPPGSGGVVMRLLLGRCAPVHAPPLASA